MSNLIEIIHPFQIKDVKSINEYLLILKNIINIISKKGCTEKPLGISIPVRWSILYNDFVVDFGSGKQRDILGISLNNLSLHYNEKTEVFNSIVNILTKLKNSSNSHILFEQYNLKKNENRFFNFVAYEEIVYITGLYNRCQNSKRKGLFSNKRKMSTLIDNSIDFLKKVQKELKFIVIPRNFVLEKSSVIIYSEFFKELEKTQITVKENKYTEKILFLNEYLNKDFKKSKIGIKKYKKILLKEEHISDDVMLWFLIYHITLLFNHEIIKNLNCSKTKNIVMYDNISNEFIKIVSDFSIKLKDNEEKLNDPLLPVSF